MIIKRRHHSVPGLNTTATADISFMLLIFFLVASSMDLDKGLARVLPPVDDEEQKVETLVERDQLFTISLTANNQYVVNDQPVDLSTFHQQAADFMLKKGADHIMMIDADPAASYDAYFAIQNELAAVYRDVRNTLSRKTYGKGYAQLNESQRETIRQQCPQRIAENLTSDRPR